MYHEISRLRMLTRNSGPRRDIINPEKEDSGTLTLVRTFPVVSRDTAIVHHPRAGRSGGLHRRSRNFRWHFPDRNRRGADRQPFAVMEQALTSDVRPGSRCDHGSLLTDKPMLQTSAAHHLCVASPCSKSYAACARDEPQRTCKLSAKAGCARDLRPRETNQLSKQNNVGSPPWICCARNSCCSHRTTATTSRRAVQGRAADPAAQLSCARCGC